MQSGSTHHEPAVARGTGGYPDDECTFRPSHLRGGSYSRRTTHTLLYSTQSPPAEVCSRFTLSPGPHVFTAIATTLQTDRTTTVWFNIGICEQNASQFPTNQFKEALKYIGEKHRILAKVAMKIVSVKPDTRDRMGPLASEENKIALSLRPKRNWSATYGEPPVHKNHRHL